MVPEYARIVTASEGFLELGLPVEAEAELEKLEGEDRTSEQVWALRSKIYRETKQWDAMRDVAKHLVTLEPHNAGFWLDASFATCMADGLLAAYELQKFGLEHLPQEAEFHYRLACYAAQLGKFNEAREHLRAAVGLNGDLKHAALQDPDMEPLWASIGI